MAERFDVPTRLAEGREAVEHTQTYVSACRLRGYQHPDLTAHGAQVRDWYDSEDGLDLRLLDGDCAELRAVVDAAEEALRVQRTQAGELGGAWRGPGADAAVGFLRRHCAAAEAVAAGLRVAAEQCAVLRDELWRLVDDKVATALAADDRTGAQRPAWLAAAHTVMAGARDAQAAEDIIDHEVKPYVDNDIGTEWLTAMRSARTSVAGAYDAAAAAVAPAPGMVFQIPAELGPRYQPDEPVPPAPMVPIAPVAAVGPPPDPPPARPDPVPAPAAPPDPSPGPVGGAAPTDDAAPTDAGLPGGFGLPTGAGLPLGGGGLGGLIPRIADAIGGLGSPEDVRTGHGLDEPVDDEPVRDDADDEPVRDGADDADDTGDTGDEPGEEAEPAGESDQPEAEPVPAEPADEVSATHDEAAVPPDQHVAPVPPNPQAGDAKTPCEIAADELPQAGQ